MSFRSIGHASVGDIIGCDVSHRPPAFALRDLTDAFPPAGVCVYFLRLYSLSFAFYDNIFVLSQPLSKYFHFTKHSAGPSKIPEKLYFLYFSLPKKNLERQFAYQGSLASLFL